ncbi:MAG: hypothetical protein ABI885_15985 [Gammaproteobacteria bacterium]
MLKSLSKDFEAWPLPDLGAIRVQGADNLRFLQGQLSNDSLKVSAVRSQLSGLHTPQGRAAALLRLVVVGPDDVLAVLPRELAAPVAARLSKYVLRAKAKVSDVSADWSFQGLLISGSADGMAAATRGAGRRDEEGDASASLALPDSVNGQAQYDSSFVVRVSDSPARWLVATPTGATTAETSSSTALVSGDAQLDLVHAEPADSNQRDRWHALDIAAGIPQIYAATTEAFVAQMLNLDVLNAVAFDKGCYTGQEIIARAHYRGKVKRRMQRFRTLAPAALAIGDSAKLRDGRSVKIVEAVQLPDGRCEFLAVAPLGVVDEEPASTETAGTTSIDAEQLTLPYVLPD